MALMANIFTDAPEGQPKSFVTGDYVTFKRSDLATDYPTAEYTATLLARGTNDNVNEFEIGSTKEDGYFLFTATSIETATILPEDYRWQIEISRDSDGARVVVDRGRIQIITDLDTSGLDARSHSAIMLAKIESLLSGKADSDVAEYEVGGRSLKKLGFMELVQARDYYRAEIVREQNADDVQSGRQGKSTIKVRF
jgi:hypothetical protein